MGTMTMPPTQADGLAENERTLADSGISARLRPNLLGRNLLSQRACPRLGGLAQRSAAVLGRRHAVPFLERPIERPDRAVADLQCDRQNRRTTLGRIAQPRAGF